jgi:hypothetical protein
VKASAFSGWTGGCVGRGRFCTVIADKPVDLVLRPIVHGAPKFTDAAALNVTVFPPTAGVVTGRGIRCGGPRGTIHGCQSTFAPGSKIVLRARPLGQRRAVRWLSCRPFAGDASRCRVLVEDGMSVEALFR